MTYGQLFQDPKYKAQIVKAFEENLESVHALTPKQQRSIQLLKTYIRIARTSLPILIDIGISIYVILKDLTKKLRLKIKANDGTKVTLLGRGSKVRVIGLILNALIAV